MPMLYKATPELIAAAYRVADSSTNIITPMMAYAGVILAFMRKYKPNLSLGDVIAMILPYSLVFLIFLDILVSRLLCFWYSVWLLTNENKRLLAKLGAQIASDCLVIS